MGRLSPYEAGRSPYCTPRCGRCCCRGRRAGSRRAARRLRSGRRRGSALRTTPAAAPARRTARSRPGSRRVPVNLEASSARSHALDGSDPGVLERAICGVASGCPVIGSAPARRARSRPRQASRVNRKVLESTTVQQQHQTNSASNYCPEYFTSTSTFVVPRTRVFIRFMSEGVSTLA